MLTYPVACIIWVHIAYILITCSLYYLHLQGVVTVTAKDQSGQMTCSATRRIFTVHEFSTLPRSQLIVLAGLDFSPLLSHPRPCPCSPVCPDAQLMPDASTSATFNEEIHRNTWREEPEATELSTSKLATCRLFS